MVKAESPGTYEVFKTAGAVLDVENQLVAAATEDIVADGTQFILAKASDGIGFYRATEGTIIAAGKGYLSIGGGAAKAFYPFEGDGTTGISQLASSLSHNRGEIYNLAGQRLSKMQKGIFIQNGKKLMVK